jgi:hypothetical protein
MAMALAVFNVSNAGTAHAAPAHASVASKSAKPGKPNKPGKPAKPETGTAPARDQGSAGADTPERRALYAAERELFPPSSASLANLGMPWPDELPFRAASSNDRPRVHASGLPPAPLPNVPVFAEGGSNLSWLVKLEMPDLPVRWDPRVVRYLEFFKNDPRGHAILAKWIQRSGRYQDSIRKILKRKGIPEDLIWLSMLESSFDPNARSRAGAVGLWQFTPETGKLYGLEKSRKRDPRRSVVAATEAAADFLSDLYGRFGSWDLAMAAYNMGYGGTLSAVRKYNTNDFWMLSKLEGAVPWETTLYVPKILAVAIASKNLAIFGFENVVLEPPLDSEEVLALPDATLATVAKAARREAARKKSTDWLAFDGKPAVMVPQDVATYIYPDRRRVFYRVVADTTLGEIAAAVKTSPDDLARWNRVDPSARLIEGMTMQVFVPYNVDLSGTVVLAESEVHPVVVGTSEFFELVDDKGRSRIVITARAGDTLESIGKKHGVGAALMERINRRARDEVLAAGDNVVVWIPHK